MIGWAVGEASISEALEGFGDGFGLILLETAIREGKKKGHSY